MVKSNEWLNVHDPNGTWFNTGHSEETKRKLSLLGKGHKHTEETKKKFRERRNSEERRKQISAANKRQDFE